MFVPSLSWYECFPYVCPEPVLVKCSSLYINGSKSGVFRTPGKLKLAASAEIAASPTGRNTLLLLLLRSFCPEPAVANSWSHFFTAGTATCIIIAPKRLKLRLSGSARKSQKRFQDTPRFKFQAVLARTQPFLSRSVKKQGDQSRFKCRKKVNYYAIRSKENRGFQKLRRVLLQRALTYPSSL